MPKFHKSSIFGDGPRVVLDREQRAQFRAKVKLQRRPGRLTIATAAIALVLIDMLGPDGRLDPSHATLATLACVSLATVKRALDQLQACGFLDWTRRLIRGRATGGRTKQTSNAYVLRVPACDAHFAPRVGLRFQKRGAQEAEMGWEEQVQRATQMILALGGEMPAHWGAV